MGVFQFWLKQFRRVSFRILFLALVLAVASIASVGVFSSRIEAALQRDAKPMLGGDVVVESSSNPMQTAWFPVVQKTEYNTLARASSVQFPTVVSTDNADLLVSLKAVDGTYPLLGTLRVQDGQGEQKEARHGPAQGEFWIEQQALDSLGMKLGDTLTIGQLQGTVSNIISLEPERNGGFVNFSPRVLMHMDDLMATGLLGPGSRAKWRLYLMGPNATLGQLQRELQPLLSASDELLTLEKGRPEVNKTLDIAKDFLSMSALIASLIACVGIALASHHFAKEQAQDMAILKSLGFTPKQLLRTCVFGLFSLAVVAGALGMGLGWCAHWGLLVLLSGLMGVQLPLAGLHYLPLGMGLSLVLLLGFAVLPIWNALQTLTIAVIRQQSLKLKSIRQRMLSIGLGVLGAWGMCFLVVKNIKLAMLLFAGFLGTALLFAAAFSAVLVLLPKRVGFRASLSRRASVLVLQGVSLSIGLSALLILAVVQGNLIDRWQAVIPAHAPNRFMFNIQPDQKDAIQTALEQATQGPVRLYPMVRGRLVKINGQAVSEQTYTDQRAKNLVQREFNLSHATQPPSHNRIAQGAWFNPSLGGTQISLEHSMAERLGLRLGDQLVFDIAGAQITAQVSSIRELRWDSMEVNFFAMFTTDNLPAFPETWITSVHLPIDQASAISRPLLKAYPNITVLNTDQLLSQMRSVLGQVSQAVQFVFLFTVLAGGLVVFSCMFIGAKERTQQAAIYRAMGASSRQLLRAAWLELGVLGALSGFVAALVAQGTGWGIAHFVFEFDYAISLPHVLGGTLLGVVVSVVFGAWFIQRVCDAPVVQTLRQL